MKYRIQNEFSDMLELAENYAVDINKHGVKDYDIDAVKAYASKQYVNEAGENQVTITDYHSVPSNPDEFYRVFQVKFHESRGEITLFGSHIKMPAGKIVVDKPVEPSDDKKEDDKPVDLSEIPF